MRDGEQVPFRLWAPGRLHAVVSMAMALAMPVAVPMSPAAARSGDPVLTVTPLGGTIQEGDGGTGTGAQTFDITLSAPLETDLTFGYAFAAGTATDGEDFDAVPTTPVTIEAGQTLVQVPVEIRGDEVYEGADETFTMTLTGLSDTIQGDREHTFAIADDDTPPTIDMYGGADTSEGAPLGPVFTVTGVADDPIPWTATVQGIEAADNDAAGPQDIILGRFGERALSGTIKPGDTNITMPQLGFVVDGIDEADETLKVVIDGGIAGTGTAYVGSSDSESERLPKLMIPAEVSVTEGEVTSIPVDLDFKAIPGNTATSTERHIYSEYTVKAGSASTADYGDTSGYLMIRAGEASGRITIPTTPDAAIETPESFKVTYSGEGPETSTAETTVTIRDAPPVAPKVSVRTPAAKVVAEGKTLRFPVTLSGASDKPITVRVATADGTATTADGDYTAVTEDVVFGPGETVKHVEVPTIRDTEQETEPETLDLRVTDAGGAVRSETPAATGSVLDATIAVGTQGVIAEGDSGVTEQYFAVLLNVDVDEEVRLNYQVLHDTTDDVDLDTVSGTLVFPPGTYQQFMVPIHGDTSDEGAGESFTIRLSGLTGVEATGLGDHRFRIVDDDGAPSIASVAREFPDGINPDVEDEGNTTETAPFTVELSHPAPGPIVLDVTGADQTAVQTEGGIAGADYSVPSSVTFEEGEKTKTFDVTINGDAVWEDTETAMIMVSPRDGDPNVIGDPAGAELRLENDDAPPALTLNTGASGTEGGTVDVIATPAGIAEDPIGYLLRLSGDTSGADPAEATDFTGGDVKVTVPGGGTGPVTLHSIKLAGDTVDEASESIEAVLEHPAAPPAEARYEIRDDPLDSPPAVSVGSVTAAENQGFAEVPVTLEFLGGDTTSTEQRVSAGYEVLGGSEDVAEPRTGIVEFGPGQTNSVIRVPIVDDKRAEPEGSVTVRVFGPSPDGVGINQAEGRIVITDDDKAVPAFAVTGAVTAGEASGSAAVEVSLSEPAPVDIDLDVAIGSGTATPSRDYGEPATTVRIPEGRSSALITVPIRQDEVYEGDETAVVTVSSAGGSSQQAAVTITDDDPEPTVTFAQTTATVAEGGSLEVRGTVTGTPQRDYVIGDGEATATTARTRPVVRVKRGERRRLVVERGPAVRVLADDGAEPADYDLGDGLVIPAGTPSGSTTTLGTIRFADDSIDEDDEIAELTVAGGVIRFRITDDPADRPPTVSIGDAAVSEDDDAAELPVTLDFRGGAASTERVVTVPWQTVDGTAEAGRDYRKSGGAVTIDPLAGSATVRVPLIDDTRDEKAQSFTVRLGAAAPAGVPVTGGPGTVTITDDDKATAPTLTAPATQAGSGRVVLSGVAAAGAKVELLSAGGVAGGTFKVIGTTVADDDGAYTFQPTIGIGVRFQTRAAGLSSPVRVVRIRQEPSLTAVSNARGQVTLTVAGDPDEGGQTVRVQRRIRGEWREVDDGRLGPRGRFATTVRGLTSGGTAVFRAVITATPSLGILAGTSASRTVKVK